MFTQTVRLLGVRALLVVAALAIAAASASAHPESSPTRVALSDGTRVQLELSDCIHERIRERAALARLHSLQLSDRIELEPRLAASLKLVEVRGFADRLEIIELAVLDRHFGANARQPASSWVDTFTALAKLPGRGAVVAQRVIVTFAKVLSPVAQAIF